MYNKGTIGSSGGGGSSAATRATFNNANYAVAASDRYVAQIGTLTASRTVTLPAASSVAGGTIITVADESGTVTATNTIVVSRAGTDTINGATTATISYPYGTIEFISDGTSKWTLAQEQVIRAPGLKTGRYHILSNTGSVGGAAQVVGDMTVAPLIIGRTTVIDRIGCKVTTAAATSIVRFGIYADDGYGYPGALVADFGAAPYSVTADASTTGDKNLVLAPTLTLTPGVYWIAVVVQVAGSSLQAYTTDVFPFVSADTTAKLTSGSHTSYNQGSVTGALPASFTGTSTTTYIPIAWVRAA